MTFEEYQNKAAKTAVYPKLMHGSVYPALGLAGEAGEVAEKVKKLVRDDKGVVSEEKRSEVAKELGDVLWYVSQVATEFDIMLTDVATQNLEKLASRKNRDRIHGSGDNR